MRVFLIGLLIAVLASLSTVANATEQTPERILIDGESAYVYATLPLSAFELEHPQWVEAIRDSVRSTALYRGYQGTWEVSDGKLWLRKIEIDADDGVTREVRDVMREVFPGQDTVVASWYTGTLVVPRGTIIHFDRMEQKALFERYTLVRIVSGQVMRRLDMEGEAFVSFREAQFDAYRRTQAYREAFEAARARSLDPDIDTQLFELREEVYLMHDEAAPAPTMSAPTSAHPSE